MLNARAQKPIPVVFPPEGIFVLESRHQKGFHMETTTHDFWKILYVFRGSGVLVDGMSPCALAGGDVAVVPPGKPHHLEDHRGTPLSLYGVCIQPSFLAPVLPLNGISNRIQIHRHPPWAGELAGLLRSLLMEQDRRSPESRAWAMGLTWQILGLVWRAESRKRKTTPALAKPGALARERIEDYARQLGENFLQEMSLDEAASRLGLGRRRFTQLFRETMGASWLQTVRHLKIGHAQKLLRETNRSVTAIAFESGFSDLSHFYRVFRGAVAGLSPEEWRKAHRRGPER